MEVSTIMDTASRSCATQSGLISPRMERCARLAGHLTNLARLRPNPFTGAPCGECEGGSEYQDKPLKFDRTSVSVQPWTFIPFSSIYVRILPTLSRTGISPVTRSPMIASHAVRLRLRYTEGRDISVRDLVEFVAW